MISNRCSIFALGRFTGNDNLSAQTLGVSSLCVKEKWNVWLPLALMLIFALTRWPGLLPLELSNFSPAYALAFCAGIYFPSRLVWWLPLGTLLLTDILLNLLYYHTSAVSAYMAVNYLVYAALIWLGRRHSPRWSWLRLLGGGLFGAILFYLVTNTAAWVQNPGYPKTLAGWIQALTSGIPGLPPTWTFFRNTLLSGGLFTGLFVGAMKLGEVAESAQEKEPAAVAADEESEPEESKA
jgi:hypothetical protein